MSAAQPHVVAPVNPPLPLFYARCVKCNQEDCSLSLGTGEKPFTYICFRCQSDAEREAIRMATNAAIVKLSKEQPSMVAMARRILGIARPARTPMDASWAGCWVQQ